MQLLENPVWQGISALIGIAAILVSWFIYRLQTKKAKFNFEVISTTLLVNQAHSFPEELEIVFQGKKVQNLRVLSMKFRNAGRVPIRRDDFDGPLKLTFPQIPTVLVARQADATPDALPLDISIDSGNVIIAPLLLNPSDSFVIQCIYSSVDLTPRVQGRIAGINQIEAFDSVRERKRKLLLLELIEKLVPLVLVVGIASSAFSSKLFEQLFR